MDSQKRSFDELSIETLDGFVVRAEQEGLHLEFKTLGDGRFKKRDDRSNLARVVSGFANSDGGICVWGVSARPDPEGVDCARELQPIVGLRLLLSRLNELCGEATNPTVDLIEHKLLPIGEEDRGYAATLVPRSEAAPHMAKLGEDRYFKRAGSRFVRLEHFDLEDMFGRRPSPRLELSWHLGTGGSPYVKGPSWDYTVFLGLRNAGRGAARAPYLAVKIGRGFQRAPFGLDGNKSDGLPRLASSQPEWLRFGATADTVVHADMTRDVLALQLPSARETPPPLSVAYEIGAIGCATERGCLDISNENLVRATIGVDP